MYPFRVVKCCFRNSRRSKWVSIVDSTCDTLLQRTESLETATKRGCKLIAIIPLLLLVIVCKPLVQHYNPKQKVVTFFALNVLYQISHANRSENVILITPAHYIKSVYLVSINTSKLLSLVPSAINISIV